MPETIPQGTSADDIDDVGATLEKNWDAQVPDAPAASPSSDTPPTAPTEAAPTGEAAARARDDAGRFTKAEKAALDAKAAAAVVPEIKIPEKWPADVRAKLESIHKVNPEHAQFVLEQYAHFRNIDGQREARANQALKPFDDLLAPGRQARALKNIDDVSYTRNLIAAGDFLEKNPREGLKYLAKTYGIDLQQLANPEAGGEPEIPPYVRQTQEELAQIKQFIAQSAGAQQQQQLKAAGDWINSFASQKDEHGQPKYPHFDDVINELIVNVQYQRDSGQPVDVEAAYKRAVRMNDSVWLKEQAASSESARKAGEARRLREIEDAKRAEFSVSGSGAGTTDAIPDDIGEHLARNYDKFVRS